MNTFSILLQKMRTEAHSPVQYYLSLGEEELFVNELLNQNISLTFSGYQCLNCGKPKEIYRQGLCKKCFFEAPQVGEWIIRPELSKAHLGIEDRDLAYEQQVQLQPHLLYLANSSEVKVGVTRKTQMPTRWIDQGAHQALIMIEVPNRYLAGIAEVALKAHISDKTNWRKMLTNQLQEVDLQTVKKGLEAYLPQEVLPYLSEVPVYHISYPVLRYPTKVTSLTMPKTQHYEGKLMGIKGQYLIFEDNTVFNVRGHEGFIVEMSF
ncbi:MAG: DUF2797 domain-containing protein [Capnocytophaga sp.]|jgi:hypothetical protein|uniref:DUF2797 domain-containing protein n=1 Tax=uncultured Capnocytophaga sp. TaxID=159273 RepID=UPI000F2140FA|nr:DUF2797 domain-containing protein [uncultured Capnocytophaga sp.]RKW16500.1 MAG: DUF2797 domain-containing protein [Capnocytophaga sp.]